MLKLYRFVNSTGKEVCINPDYVLSVEKHHGHELCTINLINGLSYILNADINTLSEALEVTSNSKKYL
jgi:uncharacterized protein YlzI (FlbEa/FlbD family)